MADISKIKLPDNVTYNVKDTSAVNSITVNGTTNYPVSGDVDLGTVGGGGTVIYDGDSTADTPYDNLFMKTISTSGADIVKQIIDADGNNIFPNVQGGSKFIKLWENPSTEATGAFNVTVDNSYDLYFVNARSTDSGIEHLIPFMLNGRNVMMAYVTASGHRYTRTFTANTSGLLEFNVGQYDGSTNNIAMLPRMVYGLKSTWIVPTTVQGLQYIEV